MVNNRIPRALIVFTAILVALVLVTAVSAYSAASAGIRSRLDGPMSKLGTDDPVPVLSTWASGLSLEAHAGDTAEAEVRVAEIGGRVGVLGIRLQATDLSNGRGQVIAAGNVAFEPSTFDLPAGAEQDITVTVTVPEGTPRAVYRGYVVIESLNAGTKTNSVTVYTRPRTLIIKNEATSAGATLFDFTGDLGEFSLQDGEEVEFPGGGGTIYEQPEVGWVLDRIECRGDTSYQFTFYNGVTIYPGIGETVTCTFFNQKKSPDSRNMELIGQAGGATGAVAVQGDYAYLGEGPRLAAFDVSDPAKPTRVGDTRVLPGIVGDLTVSGEYAYAVVGEEGLYIFDISDPRQPVEIASLLLPDSALELALSGDTLFIAARFSGLRVIDVADPTAPKEIAFEQQTDEIGTVSAWNIALAGDYLYVDWYFRFVDSIIIYDVSESNSPTYVGWLSLIYDSYTADLAAAGDYAYLVGNSELTPPSLDIYNVSDPYHPIYISSYESEELIFGIEVTNDLAYLTTYSADDGNCYLQIIDVSDPANPTLLSRYERTGDLAIAGDLAYMASRGLHIVDVSNPVEPQEAGSYEPALAAPWLVAVHGDTALVAASGYGSTILQTVDITDAAAPAPTGFSAELDSIEDVVVEGGYAYVAEGDLRIYSLADPAAPLEVALLETPGESQDIAVHEDLAFVSEAGVRAVRIIDVSNPAAPTEIGHFATEEDDYFLGGVAAEGNYTYVAAGYDGLIIIDISHPESPVEVGSLDTIPYADDVEVSGNRAYVLDNYSDETPLHIIDVTDPAQPVEAGDIDPPKYRVGAVHDLAVDGCIVTITYSLNDNAYDVGGVQVVDACDPAAPVELGYFKTPGSAYDVALGGAYVTVADGSGGLDVLRYTGPADAGTITIGKETEQAADDDFTFAWDLGGFTLNSGENTVFGGLAPGSYTFMEAGQVGWELERVVCDSTAVTQLANGVTIELAQGQDVTCTFHNSWLSVTAEAGGPYAGDEGWPISLDASETIHPEMVYNYKWDCTNDGSWHILSSPIDGVCWYEDNGVFTLRLQTVDTFGQTSEDTAEVMINNVPPAVDAGSDQEAVIGQVLNFSGSFRDPGWADTHTVTWDFGDGTKQDGTLSPQHAYSAPGVYTVTLNVTDDDGGSGSDALAVDVINRAPAMSYVRVSPAGINEGDSFTLSGAMADFEGNSPLTLSIEWGDGVTLTREFAAGVTAFAESHHCADDPPGIGTSETYTIELKLSDEWGAFSEATAVVQVDNVAPTIDAGADQVTVVGQTALFSAAVSDPGKLDSFEVTWDFGDGRPTAVGTMVGHVFAGPGTFTVTATVEDDDGGIGRDTLTIVVRDAFRFYFPVFAW